MSLEVGGVRSRIFVETRGLHDIFEHAAHIAIYVGDVEAAVLHTVDDLLYLSRLTGLHQVVAGMHLTGGGQTFADTDPVGHNDTLESPVLTKNLGEQIVVTHRELTIHLVIRGHHCPGIALADGNLEATEIELTGCSLRHTFINRSTIGLLGVYGEVLGRDTCALTLYAIDIGGSNLTGEQRVFRVILEVTAAERITVQVHARTKDDVAAVFFGLVADGLTHLAYQFGVPG